MFSKKKLEELIAQSKLTPTEFAKKANIQQTTISRLLSGNTTKPHPDTINTLAKFFNLEPSEFFEREGITEKEETETGSLIKFKNTREVLEYLMLKTGIINTTMLHNKTGVPMTSLNRILKGETEKSSIKTLQQLANYFNITLTQLKAIDGIPSDKYKEVPYVQKIIPLIHLDEVSDWFYDKLPKQKIDEYFSANRKIIGEKSFAILLKTKAFEPDFKINHIIIIDSSLKPKDNDYILCSKNNTTIIGQIILTKNEDKISFRKIGEKDFKVENILNCNIFGVIVQEFRNLRD